MVAASPHRPGRREWAPGSFGEIGRRKEREGSLHCIACSSNADPWGVGLNVDVDVDVEGGMGMGFDTA